MVSGEADVAIAGAGAVGCATALALARRGASVVVFEAEAEPGLVASGSHAGILHSGFDAPPDTLETELLLRSAALRLSVLEGLGVPSLRCGALVVDAPAWLTERAERNGVAVDLHDDGVLEVPGESVTDPVAYTQSLADAAQRHGAELRTSSRVTGIEPGIVVHCDGGDSVRARVLVNCCGAAAGELARMAGDESIALDPRIAEFAVFDSPGPEALDRILVPTPGSDDVAVAPTIDGHVVAGPGKARTDLPGLFEGGDPVGYFAGVLPTGDGYAIAPSRACAGLVNVAATGRTGLSASLGIAAHICAIVEALGVPLGREQPLEPGDPPVRVGEWWLRLA